MSKETNLIWIDLEMTGLSPEEDRIIEIATIVTDTHLNIIAEGPVLAIHQPETQLAQMNEWNRTHHSQSGLLERVRNSHITEAQAQSQTLSFLQQHVEPNVSPMCGNTICQDRRFLYHYMPQLEQYFHYRHIDVSTVKELIQRWWPGEGEVYKKSGAHLALTDVKESIAELQFYRDHYFQPLNTP